MQNYRNPIFDNDNTQLMVTAAHRYCLGRRTYIVGACVDWLIAHWDELTSHTRAVIIKDTRRALDEDKAGMEIDRIQWRRLLEAAEVKEEDHE